MTPKIVDTQMGRALAFRSPGSIHIMPVHKIDELIAHEGQLKLRQGAEEVHVHADECDGVLIALGLAAEARALLEFRAQHDPPVVTPEIASAAMKKVVPEYARNPYDCGRNFTHAEIERQTIEGPRRAADLVFMVKGQIVSPTHYDYDPDTGLLCWSRHPRPDAFLPGQRYNVSASHHEE